MTPLQTRCQELGGRYVLGMASTTPPYTQQEYCELEGRMYTAEGLKVQSQRSQCEAGSGVWATFGGTDPDNSGVCQPRPGVLPAPYAGTREQQCIAAGGNWSAPDVVFPEGICRGERYPIGTQTGEAACRAKGWNWDAATGRCSAILGMSVVPPPPVRPEPGFVQTGLSIQEQRKHNLIAYGIRQRWIVAQDCQPTAVTGASSYRGCNFYRTYRVMGALRPAAPAYDFERMVAWMRARIRQITPTRR